jgi:hypothetical protein
VRKCRIVIESIDDRFPIEPRDLAGGRGRNRRISQQKPIQTALAKKVTSSENCDDGFLSVFGNDGDFDRAVYDVKNGIGGVALGVDSLMLVVFRYGSSPMFRKEGLKIETCFLIFLLVVCI